MCLSLLSSKIREFNVDLELTTFDQVISTDRNHSFSTNKTDRHDIAEILLRVALNTITLTQ
jgi:hypothetical protein